MINIIRICSIWKYLTRDTCHTLILSLAISYLDHNNLLLMDLPKKSINVIKHVQNTEARVILNRHTEDSATQCLKELCQLPTQQRIDYQICTILFKALQKGSKVSARPNKYLKSKKTVSMVIS